MASPAVGRLLLGSLLLAGSRSWSPSAPPLPLPIARGPSGRRGSRPSLGALRCSLAEEASPAPAIGARLGAVHDQVAGIGLRPDACRVADIGADHALLAAELVRTGTAASALAIDVNAEPLAAGQAQVERLQDGGFVSSRMGFIHADGLAPLAPGDVDVVTIAGMGTRKIIEILRESSAKGDVRALGINHLVLQPVNSRPQLLRHLRGVVAALGFMIEEETIVEVSERWYITLRARRGGGTPPLPLGDDGAALWFPQPIRRRVHGHDRHAARDGLGLSMERAMYVGYLRHHRDWARSIAGTDQGRGTGARDLEAAFTAELVLLREE